MERKRTQVLSLENFGCTVYVRVDLEKSDKLDAELVKCYLIGYDADMFAYKFLDDKNRNFLRHCDVTFNENFMYKNKEKKGSKTKKQVGVKVELLKDSPSDVVVDIQETSETVAEEPQTKQLTPEQVLRRSSRTIRVSDMYSPSLRYLLLIVEGEPESLDDALQVEDTTKWEQVMDDGVFRLHKCVSLSSTEA